MYTAKGRLDVNAMLKQYSPLVRRLAHHYASARVLGHTDKALQYLLEAARLAESLSTLRRRPLPGLAEVSEATEATRASQVIHPTSKPTNGPNEKGNISRSSGPTPAAP